MKVHFGAIKYSVAVSRGLTCFAVFLLAFAEARAQQLEPRAYSPSPVGINFLGLTTSYQSGGVFTDPSLPIEDATATVSTAAPFYGHTFGLLGRQASIGVVVPYSWGEARGEVQDVRGKVDRSGLLDPQVRFAVNLIGGPALTPKEFRQHEQQTTLGASITVVAPFGQYDPSRLINLGTNRWAAKPELGFSQPLGKWSFEVYAGVWLFEANNDFYGGQVKKQDPLASLQTHVVYAIRPNFWAAADFTYYTGGTSSLNGVPRDDRQDNTRGGLTLSIPFASGQSIKVSWAEGVSTRVGASFQTVGAAWQTYW